jgi:hypothetical protein
MTKFDMKKAMFARYKVAISWIFHSEPEDLVKEEFGLDDETYEFLSEISDMIHYLGEALPAAAGRADWYDVVHGWSVKDD